MVALLLLLVLSAPPADAADQPLVIAHRGASSERPEHTLAAYQLAIEQGADYLEPDLVVTRDGVLIARHDVLLAQVELDGDRPVLRDGRPVLHEATTDVAERPEFADRLVVRDLDGDRVAGWFADDFSLAEIRTLRARERMPEVRPANTAFADQGLLTFTEVLALAAAHGVGVYPELKHPSYLASRGHDVVKLLLNHPLPRQTFVQCFEVEPLRRLHQLRPDLPLIQLFGAFDPGHGSFAWPADRASLPLPVTTYADLATPAGLAFVQTYAVGIGVWIKTLGLSDRAAWLDGVPPGLQIHAYTVRPEAKYRAGRTYEEELLRLRDLGVDGVFVEDVARARAVYSPTR